MVAYLDEQKSKYTEMSIQIICVSPKYLLDPVSDLVRLYENSCYLNLYETLFTVGVYIFSRKIKNRSYQFNYI